MSDTLSVDVRMQRGVFALDARFEAPAQGVTCLFGPSGAGKSLLLSAMAGVARIDAGRIILGSRVLDNDAAHVPPHQRGVGLVFQDARLFPHLSVRGNLAFARERAPAGKTKPTIEEAAAHFDLAALLNRPVNNLSGGEKSRVALARALLSAPDFLLLDEPFAALDGQRRRAFLATLRTMHATFDLPLLVVTHHIDDAVALADHLVALDGGRVVASGPVAETTLTPGFRALLAPHDVGAALPGRALRTASGSDAPAVWLRADYVLLAVTEPLGLSARNIWRGEIGAIEREPDGSLLVHVRRELGPVLARVTPEAAVDLALARGQTVWAIVKAHSI